jgi:hypothetical protein
LSLSGRKCAYFCKREEVFLFIAFGKCSIPRYSKATALKPGELSLGHTYTIQIIMENRKFPIGAFEYGKTYSFQEVRKGIEKMAKLPKQIKKLVKSAKAIDLEKKYRPGGWTARQVIHHIADSHINAYTRFKLAMTEDHPTIRPYDEKSWAELNDGADAGVNMSIAIIKAVHKRMCYFLESLTEADFGRTYYHPGSSRIFKLGEVVMLYAWHGKHHLAHLELALEKQKASDENDDAPKEKKAKVSSENDAAPKQKKAKAVKQSDKKAPSKKNTDAKTSVVTMASVTSGEPKKRGRKPGTTVKTAVAKAPVKATTVTSGEPKKRGRKPGTTVKTATVKAPAKVTTVTGGEPKKRGRKPGTTVKSATVKAPAKATTVTSGEPKKRGRKPGTTIKTEAVKTTVIKSAPKVTTTITTYKGPGIHGEKPELIVNRVVSTEKKKPGPKPKK